MNEYIPLAQMEKLARLRLKQIINSKLYCKETKATAKYILINRGIGE